MKILAIADRPPRQSILTTVEEEAIDLICTLGDLEFSDLIELEHIQEIPKIGVYGNHCSVGYLEKLAIENVHLKKIEIGGFSFGGFEGSVRYKESTFARMYSQEEAQALLSKFPRVDVMISHSPPRGIHDSDDPAHQGLVGLLEYVRTARPSYLFHGHTYVCGREAVAEYMDTKIIHVYRDEVIDISKGVL